MNKLKFTNRDVYGKPQNVILKYENGDVEVLEFCKNTRFYDSADKAYRSYPTFTHIKDRTYA